MKIAACLLNTEPDQTSRSVHYMCKMSPTGICTFAPDKWCSLQPSLAHHSIKATVPCTPFKQSSHPNAKKTKVSQDLTKLHLGPFGCIIKALPTLKCRSAGLKIVEFELCFDSHPVFAPNLPSPTSLDCAGSWRGNYPHQHSLAVPCCPLQRVKEQTSFLLKTLLGCAAQILFLKVTLDSMFLSSCSVVLYWGGKKEFNTTTRHDRRIPSLQRQRVFHRIFDDEMQWMKCYVANFLHQIAPFKAGCSRMKLPFVTVRYN